MMPLHFILLGAFTALLISSEPSSYTDADLAAHAIVTRTLVGTGFTVVVEHPFVVAGDEAEPKVRDHAKTIVRWASDKLRRDFFAKDPEAIFTIYLFKDADSYTSNAMRLFNDTPNTPFGYCSSANRALVMNISTGGGTLVHEMVHAFMHGNVPTCPDWLNEGLASLFESCNERDGHIIGSINWRLPIVQAAITAGTAPSWQQLTSLPVRKFYLDNVGANYGTARYLLMFLQERKLLHTFWTTWLTRRAEDPTGLDTVLTLFPHQEPADVESTWRTWVMAQKQH